MDATERVDDRTVWDPIARRWLPMGPEVAQHKEAWAARPMPRKPKSKIVQVTSPRDEYWRRRAANARRRAGRSSRWSEEGVLQNLITAREQFTKTTEDLNAILDSDWSPRKWNKGNPGRNEEVFERFQTDYKDLRRAVVRAIGADIIDHPIVVTWIETHRSVGDRGELRKLRLGLEKGIERDIDELDSWIGCQSASLIDRGVSVEGIRRVLLSKANGAPDRLKSGLRRRLGSEQNLRNRLSRMGLVAAERRGGQLLCRSA